MTQPQGGEGRVEPNAYEELVAGIVLEPLDGCDIPAGHWLGARNEIARELAEQRQRYEQLAEELEEMSRRFDADSRRFWAEKMDASAHQAVGKSAMATDAASRVRQVGQQQ